LIAAQLKEKAMRELQSWRKGPRRIPACFLALILLSAGPSLRAGQIEKDSKLATKIESKKGIRVLTPEGEKAVRWPVVSDEGIASRETERGEQLAKGGVNPSTLIPWSTIRAIKVRKNAGALGALIGAVVVGSGVAAIGAGLSEGGDSTGEILLAEILFSPLGVLPGFLLGSLIPRWKTVYTAPAAPPTVPRISLVSTRRGGLALTVSLSF
jgi:hypothetical protein